VNYVKRVSIFKVGLLILLASVLITCVSAAPVKWLVADGGNGHYYDSTTLSTGITWDAANALANGATLDENGVTYKGHLVTITSANEQQFIETNLKELDGAAMGGFKPDHTMPDLHHADGWKWVTGETWGYTNWYPTEPGNTYPADYPAGEFVMIMWIGHQWGDYPDASHAFPFYRYIVEYEPSITSVPEFPSIVLPVAAILGLVVIFGRRKNMV
jgi:hypothetical protein